MLLNHVSNRSFICSNVLVLSSNIESICSLSMYALYSFSFDCISMLRSSFCLLFRFFSRFSITKRLCFIAIRSSRSALANSFFRIVSRASFTFFDDVKLVKNELCLRALFAYCFDVRIPHVKTNKTNSRQSFCTKTR